MRITALQQKNGNHKFHTQSNVNQINLINCLYKKYLNYYVLLREHNLYKKIQTLLCTFLMFNQLSIHVFLYKVHFAMKPFHIMILFLQVHIYIGLYYLFVSLIQQKIQKNPKNIGIHLKYFV